MSILQKPDLADPKLRAKLAKGMGHNYYGEPAWPNDLLYIFPVCILGTISCCIGLGVLEPTPLGEPADPFATPLEILPEWYFFPTFNLLRVIPNKLLGVFSMAAVTAVRGDAAKSRHAAPVNFLAAARRKASSHAAAAARRITSHDTSARKRPANVAAIAESVIASRASYTWHAPKLVPLSRIATPPSVRDVSAAGAVAVMRGGV